MSDKHHKLAQQILNGVLIVAVIGLLGWLSVRYQTQFDWTYGHRNTLTQASQRFLKTLHGPVKFIAFVDSSANRQTYTQWFEHYQRFKKDISVEFVDPARDPAKVKQYDIDQIGEVVVEYQGRHEKLTHLDEPAMTGALQRLADTGEHVVEFLEGHGERSLTGGRREDYDQFARALRSKGFKVESLNLVKTPKIPDNTSVLVIASPTHQMLPGEAKIVADWVAAGGNLLWLSDPDQPPQLDELAKTLGISWQNGFAVFPNFQLLGSPSPAIYLATSYPPNEITRDLDLVTVFPLARALTFTKTGDWQWAPLLVTDAASWLDAGPLEGPVSFDAKRGDIKGPLTIGATLTREIKTPAAPEQPAQTPAAAQAKPAKPATAQPGKDNPSGDSPTKQAQASGASSSAPAEEPKSHTQRVVLVGDSDFLSNAWLGMQGNEELGIDIMQWLARRDAQLGINVPKAPDTDLYLPGWASLLIATGYTFVLPVLLLGYGVGRWLVRRRA
jgi:ABC-type uncharacterized transport system involved in gliding motility auxiliary subunit